MDIEFDKLNHYDRELDYLVAEKVMGHEVDKERCQERVGPNYDWHVLMQYSNYYPAAMDIVFAMHARGYEVEIFVGHVSPGAYCKFQKNVENRYERYQREAPSREIALSMAICIASLKAAEGDIK